MIPILSLKDAFDAVFSFMLGMALVVPLLIAIFVVLWFSHDLDADEYDERTDDIP